MNLIEEAFFLEERPLPEKYLDIDSDTEAHGRLENRFFLADHPVKGPKVVNLSFG